MRPRRSGSMGRRGRISGGPQVGVLVWSMCCEDGSRCDAAYAALIFTMDSDSCLCIAVRCGARSLLAGRLTAVEQAVDLDALVRLSNEFKSPVPLLHHAGETHLVPDLLKRAWVGLRFKTSPLLTDSIATQRSTCRSPLPYPPLT
jgi:hypothetical protein